MATTEALVKLSVIMPVYNEEDTIVEIVQRVDAVPVDKEIIIVNDCSRDRTRELLESLPKKDHIRIVHHEVNKGKGAGIRTAQALVTGDVVVIQDADLEYNPEEFPKMLRLFTEHRADAVFGSRYSGRELLVDTFFHYMANKFLTTFSNVCTNLHLTDMETCYKMVRAEIFKQITIECHCFGFEPEITAKLAKFKDLRIFEVPISYEARRFDEGKKIRWTDGVKALVYIVKYNFFR
jgi:glycosyltransferase involved in cell wall biosynthesis